MASPTKTLTASERRSLRKLPSPKRLEDGNCVKASVWGPQTSCLVRPGRNARNRDFSQGGSHSIPGQNTVEAGSWMRQHAPLASEDTSLTLSSAVAQVFPGHLEHERLLERGPASTNAAAGVGPSEGHLLRAHWLRGGTTVIRDSNSAALHDGHAWYICLENCSAPPALC